MIALRYAPGIGNLHCALAALGEAVGNAVSIIDGEKKCRTVSITSIRLYGQN